MIYYNSLNYLHKKHINKVADIRRIMNEMR